MSFKSDIGVYINQKIKLKYKDKDLKLSQITP